MALSEQTLDHLLEAEGSIRSAIKCAAVNEKPLVITQISKLLYEEDKDAILDLILYSPYSPWENAWARKPNPGMLEAGRQIIDNANNIKNFKILYGDNWKNKPDESNSVMVGDRNVDQLAAENYGVKFFRCNPNIGLYDVIDLILG